jgi:magnesium transporter
MLQAWTFSPGHEAHEIPDSEIPAVRAAHDRLLWILADGQDREGVDRVTDLLALDPLVADDLRNANQRTKLECYADYCHVSVRDCTMTGNTLDAREIDVVFGDGWLLSVAERPATGPDSPLAQVRDRFARHRSEQGAEDEGFLLWALLDVIVERYFEITDTIDDRLDDVEDIVFSDRIGDNIPRELFDLRRSLVTFRRAVAPLREVLSELLRRDVDYIGEKALSHLQDVYDHVLRITDLAESQRDLLTGLLEAHLAVVSNRMNQVMKLMSSWGAILIVATLVAGIYGMNFHHMPELGWRYGYLYALTLMAVTTALLYRMFKRRDWL